jgi:hypothetical protein
MGRKNNSRLINDMVEPTAIYEKQPDGKSKAVWRDRAYQLIKNKHQVCGKRFYEDVTVCDEWCSRKKFTDWYNQQKEIQPKIDTLDLDKDILVPDNKVYCPEFCIFVPDWFNLQFIERNKERGNYPMGATYYKGGFMSNIGDGSGKTKKYLGFFKTYEEAHRAWQHAKIEKLSESLLRLKNSDLMGSNFFKIDQSVMRKITKIKEHISNGEITHSIKSL